MPEAVMKLWSFPVGAKLAREGGGTFSTDASRFTVIASKLGSHRDRRRTLIC
jgi:hypothetical protein